MATKKRQQRYRFHGKKGNMLARNMCLPDGSFFLFGPRGTGKSTWVEAALSAAS
jgi:predicted AAA+ superfamily ATPase